MLPFARFTHADLTVVVIHYRTPLVLKGCLRRVQRHCPNARLLVIECGDAAQTQRLLESFPGAELVTASNHSFAAAANAGLTHCQSRVCALLNADVFVTRETFPHLLSALGHARVGLVGPLALTPAGRVQDQGLPYRVRTAWLARRAPGEACDVPWLAGCLMAVRKEAVAAVGGMDPSFRFYNEDIDWCWRLRRAGWRSRLVNTPVLHLGGSATPAAPEFLLEGYRGGYLLSRRYHSRGYRWLHRQAVLAQALWEARWSSDPLRREAYRRIATLFRRGSHDERAFDRSPFGATLDERGEIEGGEV